MVTKGEAVSLVECKCKPGEPYADGTLPEFYSSRFAFLLKRAAKSQNKHNADGDLYFGVHVDGEHLCARKPI